MGEVNFLKCIYLSDHIVQQKVVSLCVGVTVCEKFHTVAYSTVCYMFDGKNKCAMHTANATGGSCYFNLEEIELVK